MSFYARPSWRLVGQVLGDLFVVAWAAVWWMVSRWVTRTIDEVANPARDVVAAMERLRSDFAAAADTAARTPLVGQDLRKPFDSAVTSATEMIAGAQDQIRMVERIAEVTGWVTLAIPVLLVLLIWLPGRVRFVRHSLGAQKFVDSVPDLDLLALRAMASQPLRDLARISPDPLADWTEGKTEVIRKLADLELRGSGLRRPRSG